MTDDTAAALNEETCLAANCDIGMTDVRTLMQSSPWMSRSLPATINATSLVTFDSMYEHTKPTPTTDDDTPEKQSEPAAAQSQTRFDTDEAN